MRYVYLFLVSVWLCTPAHAQISLNVSGYPTSVLGADSLKVTTAASAFPSLAPMENGMWDMAVVTDSVPVLFNYRVATSTPYQFADSNSYRFSSYNYQANVFSEITSSGIYEYGSAINKIAYSIYSITSGPTDSFIIPTQIMMYTSPRKKIAFTATANSSWSSAYSSDFDFQLTYLLESDTLAPGIVRSYFTEKDTVAGWGKMRILDASGSPSAYLNVLQLETIVTRTDSFFLKGAPISGALLFFLGVTQGQTTTTYEQNYYRIGEVTPLAQVEFRDAALTQPYKATTHVQRLNNVGVPVILAAGSVKVFPNPVGNNVINLQLSAPGPWNYALIAVNGQKVTSGILQANEKTATLNLPHNVAPGSYYLQMSSGGSNVITTQVEVVK